MISYIRVGFLTFIAAILVACGGGGGDDTPNFAGNYLFSTLNLNSNNCNAAASGTIAGGTDAVTQNGRAVSINSAGIVLNGAVDGDNGGFSVSITQVSSGVPVLSTFAFRTITTGSKYEVKFSTTAGTCSIVYVGTATKI
jgi:hypothetical protein